MDQALKQIYVALSNGKLSPLEALERIKAIKLQQEKRAGVLFVTPVWQPCALTAGNDVEYSEHHVIPVRTGDEMSVEQRYRECALACFEQIQAIFKGKLLGKVLVQIVAEDPLLAGLTGLLKTAALENPQFFGQIILVPPYVTEDERARHAEEEKARGFNPLVRYEQGTRQILGWQEITEDEDKPPLAFRDDGVYILTGGLGALGL
ncbi:MAG TPA: hypothetical protein VNN08_25075, partial [Thermoanaerobaculia bacterium]|nr:hypothetical protein [Thermoanaerobaculia bacterium]